MLRCGPVCPVQNQPPKELRDKAQGNRARAMAMPSTDALKGLREKLVSFGAKLASRGYFIMRHGSVISQLGLRTSLEYAFLKTCGNPRSTVRTLHPRHAVYPVVLRTASSDIDVFTQVFVKMGYAALSELKNVKLIMDLGANVGFASAYFLTQFPEANVVAVEPDAGNFAQLERNMAPYGSRVRCCHAGVWSHPSRLTIHNIPYRDGREWCKQVLECDISDKGDIGIDGIDISTLLKWSGYDHISLLKMDIEGAEAVIFSGNYTSWIDKVSTIAIELHDDSIFGKASEIFFSAINGRGFDVSRIGELTICKRT
jgi:FkbM family methyltransferase